MNKRIAKKLDKIDSLLMQAYDALNSIRIDDVEPQLEKAEEYAEEHENSERAQERLEMWENDNSELEEIEEELDALRSRLQDLYSEFMD
jgi:DNA repair exonuclease SbcCD ATPase subunit